MKLTETQKAVIRGYSAGAHAWLAEQDEVTTHELEAIGDSLLSFLLRETGPDQDCEDTEQAIRRLNNVVDDIYGSIAVLMELVDAAGSAV